MGSFHPNVCLDGGENESPGRQGEVAGRRPKVKARTPVSQFAGWPLPLISIGIKLSLLRGILNLFQFHTQGGGRANAGKEQRGPEAWDFSLWLVYSTAVEHLLCARLCSRSWGPSNAVSFELAEECPRETLASAKAPGCQAVHQVQGRKESVSCSVVANSLKPLWTVAHQAPLSMGFFRQEFWGGYLFPSPGDLPHPGIETQVS